MKYCLLIFLGLGNKYTCRESLFLSLGWKAAQGRKPVKTQMGTGSHTGSFVHSARNCCPSSSPGWGLGLGTCVRAVTQSLSWVWLFATPGTVAPQAPLAMGFPKQEYWSGLPFPPPGDLPNPGMEPESPAWVGRFFTCWANWETLKAKLPFSQSPAN